MSALVEVLACKDCRALAVSIDDARITGHKCSGRWETLLSERVDLSIPCDAETLEALRDAVRWSHSGSIMPLGTAMKSVHAAIAKAERK